MLKDAVSMNLENTYNKSVIKFYTPFSENWKNIFCIWKEVNLKMVRTHTYVYT